MNLKLLSSKRAFLLLVCMLTFSSTIFAQQREISGVVLDDLDYPVIGATVHVANNPTKGTITDMDGKFIMQVEPNEKALIISYVGYQNYSLKISEQSSSYSVKLVQNSTEIDELVVVAYGAMKKSDLTGSVATVEMNKLAEELPINNLAGFLQGRVAGVQVMQTSGAPGSEMSVQIRGAATITGSTEPLYVVDGVPMDDLSLVNPNDVADMQILKDASSTAIYGSRGTNGVVIVTTKSGKKGKVRVSYNGRVDISQVNNFIDVLDAYEYGLYQNELRRTSNGYDMMGNVIPSDMAPMYSDDRLEAFKTNSTDWQDLIYNTGVSHSHTLTANGGTDKSTYNISAFYSDENGVINNSSQNRYGIRMNNNLNLTSKLKLNTRVNYSQTKLGQTSHSDNASAGTVVHNTLMTKPTFGIGEDTSEDDELDDMPRDNPYKLTQLKLDDQTKKMFSANVGLSYEIIKGLFAKVNANYTLNQMDRRRYMPRGTLTGNDNDGLSTLNNAQANNWLLETLLNYKKQVKKIHRIDVLAGWTYEHRTNTASSISVAGFANDDLSFNNIGAGQSVTAKSSSIQTRILSSALGRVNYTLMDKYIFTLTGRVDGSSLLAVNNRWKFFPSGAFAWRMNQESFLKNTEWLSNLKLKASVGKTGNQNIGYGAPLWTMGTTQYSFNGTLVSGIGTNAMANPDLTWEETDQVNAGIEFGIFNNRYRLNVDAYNRVTNGLLFSFPLPESSGFSNMPINLGTIQNRGLEFEVGADIFTGDFKWSVSGNLSLDRNKVLDLSDNSISGNLYLAGGGVLNQPVHITKEGHSIGSYYGYVVDGVYQNAEECAYAPIDKNSKTTPGSLRYVDLSGPDGIPDGVIDSHDMTILGNYLPDFEYGFSTTLSYKGVSLSLMFQGRAGGEIANLNRFKLDSFNGKTQIRTEAWEGRWTGEGTSNFYPAVDGSQTSTYFSTRFSNFFLEDASFLRLKNVNISYDIPMDKVKGISSLRIFATGTNLFTITNYSGYDPEISIKASPFTRGVDYAVYPMTSTYSVGLNVTF